jgi:Tfp pilus assembly protein PilF
MMSHSIFRSVTIVAVLAFAACPALAQQIQGQVKLPDKTPAFNIPVQCSGSGCSGYKYTDRNGKFTIYPNETGNYTISISVPGYETESRSVTLIDRNSNEYMFITLKTDPKFTGPGGTTSVVAAAVIDPRVPAPAREAYELGLQEVNAAKVDKAIPHLEKAVSLFPEFLEAHLLLGTSYMDAKQWDKAEASLKRVTTLDTKRAEGHLALGQLYYQQKKYDNAEKSLLEALKIEDKSWPGHFTLARVYMDASAFAKAAPEMEKANLLRPDYAEGHFLAGNIYIKTGNAAGALKEFEEYLRLDPKGKLAPKVQATVAKLKEIVNKK